MLPRELAEKLKRAARTPVVDGDDRLRRIAIDDATAWGKLHYPEFFTEEEDDVSAPPPLPRRRGKASKSAPD